MQLKNKRGENKVVAQPGRGAEKEKEGSSFFEGSVGLRLI